MLSQIDFVFVWLLGVWGGERVSAAVMVWASGPGSGDSKGWNVLAACGGVV